MVVVSNQPRAVAFGGAALLHDVAWRGRERHVTHGADGRCGSSVVAVEADAGAVDQVAQRRPRVQVPAWRAALLAARSAASQIMRVVDHLDECFCRCMRRLCVPKRDVHELLQVGQDRDVVRAPTIAPRAAVSRPPEDGTGGGIGQPSSRPRMMLGTLGSSGGSGPTAAKI
jgi:hypothetical protein